MTEDYRLQNTTNTSPRKPFSGVDTFKESFSFGIWALKDSGLGSWGQPFFLVTVLSALTPFLSILLGEPFTPLKQAGYSGVASGVLSFLFVLFSFVVLGFLVDKALNPDAPPSRSFSEYLFPPSGLFRLLRSGFAVIALVVLGSGCIGLLGMLTQSLLGSFATTAVVAALALASVYLLFSKTFLLAATAITGSKKPLVDSYALSRDAGSEIFIILLLFIVLNIILGVVMLAFGFLVSPESFEALTLELQSSGKIAKDSVDTAIVNSDVAPDYCLLVFTAVSQIFSYIIAYFMLAAQALTYAKLGNLAQSRTTSI